MAIPDNPLSRLLGEKEVLMADGGMGTSLFELGLHSGAPGELWNLDHPERVERVHRGFVEAGSDIILTNSFGGTRFRCRHHNSEHRVRDINVAAAKIARRVAAAARRPIVVGGSMGPSGEMLVPYGERTPEEIEGGFAEQAAALKEGGVDVAWIETIFFEDELGAAVRAAQRVGLPYVLTMTFDTGGRTMMGLKPEDAIKLPGAHGWHPIAFGANCGVGPAQMLDSVIGLAKGSAPDDVIVAKANCGIPAVGNDMKVHYNGTPEVMAEYAALARDAGARIIGGCCGTTPRHLEAMRAALTGRPKGPPPTYAEIEKRLGPVKITTNPPKPG
ncbi:MAG: betaine--homocysteine S-methyltransferase [Rhodospirillales bacterium]|nr:betaine--homocysteine S-methyltransferase [Rhodospirillales bacterium]